MKDATAVEIFQWFEDLDRNDNPGFWYLATPFSNYAEGHRAAWADALSVMAGLIACNVRVISPIVHGYPIARVGRLGTDAATWRHLNEALLNKACGLIVAKMPGWNQSAGIMEEINLAMRIGLPILYLPVPLDQLCRAEK